MDDSRGIFCLSFDNMGSAAEVGLGMRVDQSTDDVSIKRGYPAILSLLRSLGLRATFFIEGWNVIHNPDVIRRIVADGHEIGLHGWVHEKFHALPAFDAERVLVDSLAAFRTIDVEPVAFRAPGGARPPFLLDLLAKHGIDIDSSVDETATQTAPKILDHDIVNLPWLWELIDYYQYAMHPAGPREPAQYMKLLEEHLDQTARDGGLFAPIMHAMVIGESEAKYAVLPDIINRARQSGLQILNVSETAAHFRASAKTPA